MTRPSSDDAVRAGGRDGDADPVDVLIAGGGPTGLACAIEAVRLGLCARVIEKGTVVDAIRRFPIGMRFFTTRERLEIGGLPLTVPATHPDREEALAYYRLAAAHFRLDVRTFERVEAVDGEDGSFCVRTRDRFGGETAHRARKVVIATGYFDHPNRLGVPGEDLPHVSHYFRDVHDGAFQDVVVVGGGNSAAETSLLLFRAGARVTLLVRRSGFDPGVKYWVRPDIENRIRAGEIRARFGARVVEIRPDSVLAEVEGGGREEFAARLVYLLTGYHPDIGFLRRAGVEIDQETWKPRLDPDTFESTRRGLYLAGSVMCGRSTSQIFIENGRFHAERIVPHIARAISRSGEPK